MRDRRVMATGLIWLGLFLMIEKITTIQNPPYDATVALILVMLVALASTAAVWVFGAEETFHKPEIGKAKRESSADARLQLLLQLMDEREKARLKDRLLKDLDSTAGGEISLEMLLRK